MRVFPPFGTPDSGCSSSAVTRAVRARSSAMPTSRMIRATTAVGLDDAQVDPADGGGVVVDQAEASDAAGAGDLDLLVELAAHRHLVGVPAAFMAPVHRVRYGGHTGHVPCHFVS